MTSQEMIEAILTMTGDFMVFMLPIMAVIAGINFLFTLLIYWTIGFARRSFRE